VWVVTPFAVNFERFELEFAFERLNHIVTSVYANALLCMKPRHNMILQTFKLIHHQTGKRLVKYSLQ
jgi:hypothetical protein